MKKYIIIIILFILSVTLVYFFLPGYENGNYGKLIINEVCANNISNHIDNYEEYSDYIEIYNGYDFDINLSGYHLTDKEYKPMLWTFPDMIIKAHDYLLVYASGKNNCDNDICHTNFKLNSDGEIIIFTDNKTNVLSRIKYNKMAADTTYGYNKKRYVYYDEPTPGKVNSKKYYKTNNFSNNQDMTIYINEYMTKNRHTLLDDDSQYNSYMEIYNYGDKDINLKGYYLSDDINNLDKYIFPEVSIKSHDYLLVYLSGKNKYVDGKLHTSFKLTNDDKYLIISSYNDKIIDKVEVKKLLDDISYGKKNNTWCYFMSGTPGYENNTKCFDELGVNNGT